MKLCPVLLGSGAILCPVAFCQLKWVPTVRAAGWRLLAPQPLPGHTVTSDPTQMGPQANTVAHGWMPPQSEWQSGHAGRPTGHCGSWGWVALTAPKCSGSRGCFLGSPWPAPLLTAGRAAASPPEYSWPHGYCDRAALMRMEVKRGSATQTRSHILTLNMHC